MNLTTFSAFTIAGSALWNGLLIGTGALLGSQYQLIEKYSRFLNYAVYAGLAATLLWLTARTIRRRKNQS